MGERIGCQSRVLDNGKGIDQETLSGGGRAGHFGLAGMQERAKLVGGKLTVLSRLEAGTEAVLTIPAFLAYAKPPAVRRSMASGQENRSSVASPIANPSGLSRLQTLPFLVSGGKCSNILSTPLLRFLMFLADLADKASLDDPRQISFFVFESNRSTTSVPTS